MKKILLVLFLFSILTYGQKSNSKTTFQNWLDFNAGYTIDQHWKFYGDVGYRIIYISDKFHRLYIRPSFSYRINDRIILHGGFGVFSTFEKHITIWELRPFQGLEINGPTILSLPLNHYFRFEERFFRGNINTFIFRARYKLGTAIQLNPKLYFPIQMEWFVNYGKDIDFHLNEFRGVIGLGYIFDHNWKFELNTIFQNAEASDDLFSFNDIIFRFRLYKEFGI
jgi:hypothetical protein